MQNTVYVTGGAVVNVPRIGIHYLYRIKRGIAFDEISVIFCNYIFLINNFFLIREDSDI